MSYTDTDSIFFKIDLAPTSLILGVVNNAQNVRTNFKIYNTSAEPLKIKSIEMADNLFTFNYPENVPANPFIEVIAVQNGQLPTGIFSKTINIHFDGYTSTLKYMLLGETK